MKLHWFQHVVVILILLWPGFSNVSTARADPVFVHVCVQCNHTDDSSPIRFESASTSTDYIPKVMAQEWPNVPTSFQSLETV